MSEAQRSTTMSKKYVTDKTDDRDGGKIVVVLSMIDGQTGTKTYTKICTFEVGCEKAASDYVAWMNGATT